MFKPSSTSLILLGGLSVMVGIIAIAWPSVTIAALVILFAVYAFIAAGLQAARAFSSATAGPVAGHLLLALIDLAAGVVALVWPSPTALALVLVVAIWAFVAGFTEIYLAFADGETAGTRTLFALTGLVSIAFGVVLAARPDIGGHPRAAVRPVQPHLRRVRNRARRATTPHRGHPALGTARRRLNRTTPRSRAPDNPPHPAPAADPAHQKRKTPP